MPVIMIPTHRIDPHVLNELKGQDDLAVRNPDGTFTWHSITLRPESPLPDHEEIHVTFYFQFWAETGTERQAALAAQENAARVFLETQNARKNQMRDHAREVNAGLNVGASWVPGFKGVLGGLGASSNGSGRSARSVVHVLLLEDHTDGRLMRYAGDFLCTSVSKSNGKDLTPRVHPKEHDADGKPYEVAVTCKACLKLARKGGKHA